VTGWYRYKVTGWYGYKVTGWYRYKVTGWYKYKVTGWYKYKVTGWGIIFICGMLPQWVGTLKTYLFNFYLYSMAPRVVRTK